MILIADGGSTKCDWAVVDSSHATLVKLFQTEGINPFAREEAEILTLLKVDVLPQTADYTIDKIYLYGAGITPGRLWSSCSYRFLRVQRLVQQAIWRVLHAAR